MRISRTAPPNIKGTQSVIQIDKFYAYTHSETTMAYPSCDRFGEIQSLRTRKDGIYRLLMAAKLGKHTVKMDTVSV